MWIRAVSQAVNARKMTHWYVNISVLYIFSSECM